MLQLTEQQLRHLQMIELEILIEIDRICRKCGIRYNIIGGTLLGAIRHKGFIPWDDDADIAMFRTEYNKFKEACVSELDQSRFYFQDSEETKGYRWSYGKLRRKNTLFLREHQEHMPYEQGVFVDIFPIDSVPDNYILRALHNFHCFCIRKCFWSEVGKVAEINILKKIIYCIINKIPRETLLHHYQRVIQKQNTSITKYVRLALMPLPNKGFGYLRKWYEKSSEYSFEGYNLYGMENYHDFLRFEFGDYMVLPPEDKRKVHPVSDILLLQNEE